VEIAEEEKKLELEKSDETSQVEAENQRRLEVGKN